MKPIFLLCCLLAQYAYTQGADTVKYTAIKWDVFSFIHPYAPPIALAVERRWNKMYSTSLQLGVPVPLRYTSDNMSGRNSGFTIRGDVKYFRRKPRKPKFEPFFGVEAFYTQHTYATDGYADSISQEAQNHSVVFSQKLYGMALISGTQRWVGKYWLWQFYFGAGIKMKQVKQLSRELEGQHLSNKHAIMEETTNQPRTYPVLAVPIHFSIAYVL